MGSRGGAAQHALASLLGTPIPGVRRCRLLRALLCGFLLYTAERSVIHFRPLGFFKARCFAALRRVGCCLVFSAAFRIDCQAAGPAAQRTLHIWLTNSEFDFR